MRSEKEMYDLILGTAKKDERIRAVYMNGSRANPNAPKDIFQDFDIVYVVTETASFIEDDNWINLFGELIIMQEPDKMDMLKGLEIDFNKSYTYLMQFTDGNRIDLHIEIKESMLLGYGGDKLTVPLLDKDNILPKIDAPSDMDYWIKKPKEIDFLNCCNEFWWVAPYCAKGLWRNEILYSLDIINHHLREELFTMLSWKVGIEKGFSLNLGKSHKYIKKYLQVDLWDKLISTYGTTDYNSTWEALLTLCDLFETAAIFVSEALDFPYNHEEGQNTLAFIKHIQVLPDTAEEIY